MHRKKKIPMHHLIIFAAALVISGVLTTRDFIPSDWKTLVFFLTAAVISFVAVTVAAIIQKRR